MTASLLLILLLVPLVGAAVVAWLPRGKDDLIRPAALITTLAAFLISTLAAAQFDWKNTGALQLVSNISWVKSFGLTFAFGIDSVSLWLILLTTFLMPIIILGSFSAVTHRAKEFFLWLLVLETAMIGTFIATDVIFFYICFEFTLIPLYFLIGIFGSTQRLKAARVFFLYTFTGSMLTFAGVLWVAWYNTALAPTAAAPNAGHWTFMIADLVAAAQTMTPTQQAWVLGALCAGFAVKVPIFPVHTWLPLAHTEAPTAGSVILAGVLLKLGTYGLLRLAIPMCPVAVVVYAPVIGTLAVTGILYTGLICWVQKDIKKLVAYSSVSHLGFCVLGMFALGANIIGPAGSVMYMINHGLSTGALFLCIGMIYERFHTREMRQYGGFARVMPVWSFFMVFFCMASVGLPGLNGFVGEFLTLMGAFTSGGSQPGTLGPAFAVPAGIGMIIGAIYILYMVGKVIFGPVKVPATDHGHGHASGSHSDDHPQGHDGSHGVKDLSVREITTLAPLAIACLVLGLFPNLILTTLDAPVTNLTAAAKQVVADRQVKLVEGEKALRHEGTRAQGESLKTVNAQSQASSQGPQAPVPAPQASAEARR
jgi:NADH-quinone oxidoreductase subunit M